MDKIENLVCIFYDMEEDPTVENLQKIAGGCQENNIGIVKINDASEAEKYGLKDQPIAMFIHKGIPSLMVGNIEDPDEVGLSYYKISRHIKGIVIEFDSRFWSGFWNNRARLWSKKSPMKYSPNLSSKTIFSVWVNFDNN